MRRIVIVPLTAIGLALLTLPAAAKGLVDAKLTGPNLPNGAIFFSHDPEAFDALDSMGLYHTGRYLSPQKLGLSSEELGPRYTLTIRLDQGAVRMYVYPYAPDGVWTYPVPGQRFTGDLAPGWWRASGVFDFLVKHGLPETRPAAPADQKTAGVTDASGGWPWLPIGITIGVFGVVSAFLVNQQLSRTRASR
jgi:hypothetical protein